MSNPNSKQWKKIVVIGAGPVGCAEALWMEKRGHHVDVYEMREDPRISIDEKGSKSINLTISHRGLSSLEKINMKDRVCRKAIPCYGRMIHDRDKTTRISLYGEKNESILSVNREVLHTELVDAVDKCPNTRIFFNHKLVGTNFDKTEVTFQTPDPNRPADDKDNVTITSTVKADVILGCDGANSCMRKYMNRESYLRYKEESIDERYTELTMPATKHNKFAMKENYLHIWARDEFMLLALPNQDKSFTVTLFMPTNVFESLTDREAATAFVNEHFADAVSLIGEEQIVDRLTSRGNAHSLMWVKCSRYNIDGKVLLLGDAAHAMVPFYGQGVNCGFEDLMVLDKLLDDHNEDFEKAMNAFSEKRTEDAAAMCDLSLENYNELKRKVNTPWLSCRKRIDSILYRVFPSSWVPIYTMVAFSDIRYSDCVRKRKWQNKMIYGGVCAVVIAVSVITGLCSIAYTHGFTS
ncbi:kynurenine 3-monooxygenase-like isoform X2 [Mercenaria mercenaria]|uniref:kynurenine 3-monooxygenase-like isoform X2 n=1 Tax=Mercenaria mercenaria TaxID=6596 RepID=UPI001E1DAD66|nr:kynurenine 3-monooxygenase-like isoform X2 [Mercenaria mercenaria]